LRQAQNLSVYLHANALRFDASDNGRAARQLNVGVLPMVALQFGPASTFLRPAESKMRACFCCQRARLALAGNEHDLVGRFFMLHLEYTGGAIVLTDPYADLTFQTGENGARYKRLSGTHRFLSYIRLSDETKRQLKLPSMRLRFQYPRIPEVDALMRLIHRTDHGAEILRDLGS